MQAVPDLVLQPGAREAAAEKAGARPRLAYLNTLRVILIVLVIAVHSATTYGGLGGWMFAEPVDDLPTEVGLSLFVILCQSFFMGLFFFLSGYFTPASYDRKGPARFLRDRLVRLGLPFLVFLFVLSLLPSYLSFLNEGGQPGLGAYLSAHYWDDLDAGPTWFLFALLGFDLVYILVRLAAARLNLARRGAVPPRARPVPTVPVLLGFALLMAALMFLVSQFSSYLYAAELWESITLRWSFFPQYILAFAAGALAYRSDWLARLPARSLRLWGPLAAALGAAYLPFFLLGGAAGDQFDRFWGGMYWQTAVFSLLIGLFSVSASLALILWLRGRVQTHSPLMAEASAANFTAYLIHPLVLVPVTYALTFVPAHPLLKFALAILLSAPLTYLLSAGVRRLPGVRAIL